MHRCYSRQIAISVGLLIIGILPFSARAEIPFAPSDKPTLQVGRCQGRIDIDGDFTDPGWQGAAKAVGFAETSPGERVRPPVETEVLVTYDDENFYLGFLCHDDPKTVRASLRDRDEIFSDDYVGILFDTYGDAAWAYEVFVNPLGLQGDLRMLSSGEEDVNFDIVFASRGKVTDQGYQVEVAIPFSSLRFPDRSSQEWRATFWRNRPRASRERSSWAAINRNDPCFICQFGTLTGIENVEPGRSFEFLPSLIGFQASHLRDPENSHSKMFNGNPDAEGSLNFRYLFSSALTADLTYNPDYSQVESDPAQIDVNNPCALYYPEKRPFFQEGSDLFESFINAVYTRSINDPQYALKLTGRLGRTSVGYIGARDEKTPIILPFEEKSAELRAGRSWANILRVRQTFLQDSHIGALATDRRLEGGGSGSLFGGDLSLRFLKNYRVLLQALASRTIEPEDTVLTRRVTPVRFDEDRHTSAFDGESYWGHATYAALARDARVWNSSLEYVEYSPTFRVDNGYIERSNRRQASFWSGLFFRPASKIADEITPTIFAARVWNFADQRKDEWVVPELSVLFKAQTSVHISYLWSRETYHGIYFPGIRRFELGIGSNFSEPVNLELELNHGRFIARMLETPVLGKGTNIGFGAAIKPWQQLIIQPSYEYSELSYPDSGGMIYSGYVLRAKVNYQFSREWFLRLVVQYDDFDKSLAIEPLLSYKLNPFTIFYVGSTHAYRQFDGEKELTQTGRQFFFKLQYLLRV